MIVNVFEPPWLIIVEPRGLMLPLAKLLDEIVYVFIAKVAEIVWFSVTLVNW